MPDDSDNGNDIRLISATPPKDMAHSNMSIEEHHEDSNTTTPTESPPKQVISDDSPISNFKTTDQAQSISSTQDRRRKVMSVFSEAIQKLRKIDSGFDQHYANIKENALGSAHLSEELLLKNKHHRVRCVLTIDAVSEHTLVSITQAPKPSQSNHDIPKSENDSISHANTHATIDEPVEHSPSIVAPEIITERTIPEAKTSHPAHDSATQEEDTAPNPENHKTRQKTAQRTPSRFNFATLFAFLSSIFSVAIIALLLKPSDPIIPTPNHRNQLEQLSDNDKSIKSVAYELKMLDDLAMRLESKSQDLSNASQIFQKKSETLLLDIRGALPSNTTVLTTPKPSDQPLDALIVITHGSTFNANNYTDIINSTLKLRKDKKTSIGVAVASTQQLSPKIKFDETHKFIDTFHEPLNTDSEAPDRIGDQVLALFTNKNQAKRKVILIVSQKCAPLTTKSTGWSDISNIDVIIAPPISLLGDTGVADWRRLSEWHSFIDSRLATGHFGQVRWITKTNSKDENTQLQSYLNAAIRAGN